MCTHRYSRLKSSTLIVSASTRRNSTPIPSRLAERRDRRPPHVLVERVGIIGSGPLEPNPRRITLEGGTAAELALSFNNVERSSPALETTTNWAPIQPRAESRCAIVGRIVASSSAGCINASSMIATSRARPRAPARDGVTIRYVRAVGELQLLVAALQHHLGDMLTQIAGHDQVDMLMPAGQRRVAILSSERDVLRPSPEPTTRTRSNSGRRHCMIDAGGGERRLAGLTADDHTDRRRPPDRSRDPGVRGGPARGTRRRRDAATACKSTPIPAATWASTGPNVGRRG